MSHDWCELGTFFLDQASKSLFVQCRGGAVDEDGTAPDYGQVPMMCALGLSAAPYQATKDGAVEAVVARDIPGIDGAVVAARDTRSAKIVGNLKPGDTVLHSTGPKQAAQVQLKEDKQQAAILTKTSGGKTMMFLLDGDADVVQLTHAGAMFQIDKSGDIAIVNGSGAGLLVQGGNVHVIGNPVLGAGNPPMCFALCTPAGYPLGGIVACQGVTPGT